jgi:AcrR family transcriptional regulator
MVKKADIPDHIIDTALALAAKIGWRDLSLAEIAAEAETPLSKVYPLYASKQDILDAFSRRVDAAVLAEELDEEEMAQPARDRVFDVLMRRFDLLQPHREALANIIYDQMRDPAAGLCSLVQLRRSMGWMLEAAGLSAGGLKGALRLKGLMAIYLATLRTWLKDDTDDLSKTMATLDGYLRRLEGLGERLRSAAPQKGGGDGGPEGDEEAAETHA